MTDRDLSEIYGVDTRALNQAVKRNIERFPDDFRFQLSAAEFEDWKSQFVISNEDKMGLRRPPYVFTEQGVSMLSAVLRSQTAIKASIAIINAFVEMRKFIANNAAILQRLDRVEQKQLETGQKFEQIFKALEDKSINPKQGIFYDGQIFDAYTFVGDLIRAAKRSIILIDNYIDDSVLIHFTKRKKNVDFSIFTKNINKPLKLDIEKHNQQYKPIKIKKFIKAHDRFLIIDETTVYHFGASLKDLGKKWFAFSKMEMNAKEILKKIEKGAGNE